MSVLLWPHLNYTFLVEFSEITVFHLCGIVIRKKGTALKQMLRRGLAHIVSRLPKGVLTGEEFFSIYEKRGIYITPAHYYYPIPIFSELDNSVYSARSGLPGVDMNGDGQAALVERFVKAGWFEAYRDSPRPGFGGVDGRMLYAMIRDRKPRRFIEIGSGSSTLIARQALADNAAAGGPKGAITAIEPFEASWLEEEIAGVGEIIRERVEKVPLSVFEELEAGDILFIDSSHTVRIGGDVVFEICEILPRLKPGVTVHIHDIALPFNYSHEFRFWSEQYLLQAFLAFNSSYRILFAYAWLQAERREVLESAFPGVYMPDAHQMGNFWMERV